MSHVLCPISSIVAPVVPLASTHVSAHTIFVAFSFVVSIVYVDILIIVVGTVRVIVGQHYGLGVQLKVLQHPLLLLIRNKLNRLERELELRLVCLEVVHVRCNRRHGWHDAHRCFILKLRLVFLADNLVFILNLLFFVVTIAHKQGFFRFFV